MDLDADFKNSTPFVIRSGCASLERDSLSLQNFEYCQMYTIVEDPPEISALSESFTE